MTSIEVTVRDPKTGEVHNLAIYNRKGQVYIREVAEHLRDVGRFPRRAEHLATFGEVNIGVRGQKRTGKYSPGAEAVSKVIPEAVRHYQNPRRTGTKQEYYRELIGQSSLKAAAEVLSLTAPIRFEGLPPTERLRGTRVWKGLPPDEIRASRTRLASK